MTELPFQLKVDFVFDKNDLFNPQIMEKFVEELTQFAPVPEIIFFLNSKYQYETAKYVVEKFRVPARYNLSLNSDFERLPNDVNLMVEADNPELYKVVKQSSSDLHKTVICYTQTYNEEVKEQFTYIKNDKSLKNIFVFPYLTEKEAENISKGILNRTFLTCAGAWLHPVVHANGDIFCCKFHKIGSLLNSSFWEIWNSNEAERFRNELLEHKSCEKCNCCLKKYDENFFVVNNSCFEYKNKRYIFPSSVNYVKSAPKLAILGDSISQNEYECEICPIFSDEDVRNNLIMEKMLILLE